MDDIDPFPPVVQTMHASSQQKIRQLKNYPSSDLYETNKSIMKLISDGFILKREDRAQKDLYIQLIDYTGLSEFEQAENFKKNNNCR